MTTIESTKSRLLEDIGAILRETDDIYITNATKREGLSQVGDDGTAVVWAERRRYKFDAGLLKIKLEICEPQLEISEPQGDGGS